MVETPTAVEPADEGENRELSHLYSTFHDLADHTARSISGRLTSLPESLRINPSIAIHPMMRFNQYSELGPYGLAVPKRNEIHIGLNLQNIFGLSGVDTSIKQLQPGNNDEHERALFLRDQTIRNYIQLLSKFIQDHSNEFDLSSLVECLENCKAMDRLDENEYWLMYPTGIPPTAMTVFMQEVLIPACLEDENIIRHIERLVTSTYAHEYGHLVFNQIFVDEKGFSAEETALFDSIYHEVHEQIGIKAQVDNIRQLRNTDQFVLSQSISLNHQLVQGIAARLPDEFRKRYLRYARRRGLDEIFARAFCEITTGDRDIFGKSILNYAVNPYLYLYKGDGGIFEIREELIDGDFGNIDQYLHSKLSQLLSSTQ